MNAAYLSIFYRFPKIVKIIIYILCICKNVYKILIWANFICGFVYMVISFQSYKISIYIENARQFWNSVNRKPLSWSVVPKNVSVAFNIPWVVARRWRLLSHRWQTASQIAMGSSPAMFMFITFIRSDYKSLNANLILVLVLLTRGSKQILILTRGSYIMGHLFTVVLTSAYPIYLLPLFMKHETIQIKTKNDLSWVYIRQNGLCSMVALVGQPTDKIVKFSFSLGNIAAVVNLVFYALYSHCFSLLNPL